MSTGGSWPCLPRQPRGILISQEKTKRIWRTASWTPGSYNEDLEGASKATFIILGSALDVLRDYSECVGWGGSKEDLRTLQKHWSVDEERGFFRMRCLKVPLKLLSSLTQLKKELEISFLLLPQRQKISPLLLRSTLETVSVIHDCGTFISNLAA